jgi:thiamine-phosphate pyrophosphorylase
VKVPSSKPILYLITPGVTAKTTTPASPEFQQLLVQISSAVEAGIQLVQIREKRLTAKVLFNLTTQAVDLARGSSTKILVNDRSDVGKAAGADGVHLTTQSVDIATVRRTFGRNFLIGQSTHSVAEAQVARDNGANFVVFGPVFATHSKERYGPPLGLEQLRQASEQLQSFPVLALGGITKENALDCLRAGASGIAGISIFSNPATLSSIAAAIGESAKGLTYEDENFMAGKTGKTTAAENSEGPA